MYKRYKSKGPLLLLGNLEVRKFASDGDVWRKSKKRFKHQDLTRKISSSMKIKSGDFILAEFERRVDFEKFQSSVRYSRLEAKLGKWF